MKEKQEELQRTSEALVNNKGDEKEVLEPNMFGKAMAHRYGSDLGSSLKDTDPQLRLLVINKVIKHSEVDTNLITDGYHTFNELYEFRKMYNAVLFNEWARQHMEYEAWKAKGNMLFIEGTYEPKYKVHKSWKHEDGEWCFDEEKKWFIVSAMLPTGLISNHYKAEDWDLFKVPEVEKALFKYDGHTAQDVLIRLRTL